MLCCLHKQREKKITAAGGARNVKCSCVTQAFQIPTASCSGTNTSKKNNGTDSITISANVLIYVHVVVTVSH